jgi:hypothetical protein
MILFCVSPVLPFCDRQIQRNVRFAPKAALPTKSHFDPVHTSRRGSDRSYVRRPCVIPGTSVLRDLKRLLGSEHFRVIVRSAQDGRVNVIPHHEAL